jgi:hypothetical protein
MTEARLAPSRGGNVTDGGSAGASAGSAGTASEGGEPSLSGDEPGEAFGGSGDSSSGTGGRFTESSGGAAGAPGASTGGTDVAAAGSPSVDERVLRREPLRSGSTCRLVGHDRDLRRLGRRRPRVPERRELFDAGVRPAQDPLECGPCICGSVNGGTCSLAVRTYSDEPCTIEISTVGVTDTCNVPISSTAFRFEGFEFDGGSGNPSGGNLIDRPEPRFQSVARGCALAPSEAATCDRGSVCLPEPTLPFRDDLCLYRVGDHDCPDAYPDQRSYCTGTHGRPHLQ